MKNKLTLIKECDNCGGQLALDYNLEQVDLMCIQCSVNYGSFSYRRVGDKIELRPLFVLPQPRTKDHRYDHKYPSLKGKVSA